MSRKGTVSICRSKQIPRIFQRQRTGNNARSWLTSLIPDDGISLREQSDHYDLLPGSSFDYHRVQHENDKKETPSKLIINKEFIEKTWNDESCQVFCFVFILFAWKKKNRFSLFWLILFVDFSLFVNLTILVILLFFVNLIFL